MIPIPTPIETTEDEPSQPLNQDVAAAAQHPEEQPEQSGVQTPHPTTITQPREIMNKRAKTTPDPQIETHDMPKPEHWNTMSP